MANRSHSNFRWFNSLDPRQTRGRSVLFSLTGSLVPRLRHFSFQRPISAPSSTSSSSLPACPQLVQLPLQCFVAVVHLYVAGLQLLLVADDLILFRLPRLPLFLESHDLGLALASLQQQLCTQTLLCRAPAPSCNEEVHMASTTVQQSRRGNITMHTGCLWMCRELCSWPD